MNKFRYITEQDREYLTDNDVYLYKDIVQKYLQYINNERSQSSFREIRKARILSEENSENIYFMFIEHKISLWEK